MHMNGGLTLREEHLNMEVYKKHVVTTLHGLPHAEHGHRQSYGSLAGLVVSHCVHAAASGIK